jgi:hypothetical protein
MEPQSESPADRQLGFQRPVDTLGPATLASLSRRRRPGVPEHGRPCLSGKHTSVTCSTVASQGAPSPLTFLKPWSPKYAAVGTTVALCRHGSLRPSPLMSMLCSPRESVPPKKGDL